MRLALYATITANYFPIERIIEEAQLYSLSETCLLSLVGRSHEVIVK